MATMMVMAEESEMERTWKDSGKCGRRGKASVEDVYD